MEGGNVGVWLNLITLIVQMLIKQHFAKDIRLNVLTKNKYGISLENKARIF